MIPDQVKPLQYLTQDGGAAFREAFPRVAFIAPFATGKDHAAEVLGYTSIAKFAAPLYRLSELIWPGFQKSMPGGRKFLQQLGAAGRGQIDENYPVTMERALIRQYVESFIRREELDEKWRAFGFPGFWIDRALESLAKRPTPWALTDARYPNEVQALRSSGTAVFFVGCNALTLIERRKKGGYATDGAEKDSSEALANRIAERVWSENFDINHVTAEFGLTGVIWSDDLKRCPEGAWPLLAPNIIHTKF